MEEECFDIKFFINRPGFHCISEKSYKNEAFLKVFRQIPEDISVEEQKKFIEDHGFKAEITKFKQICLDDLSPEEIKSINMKVYTREETRRSAFLFEVKKDKKLKEYIRKMPNGLKKKQIAEYFRNFGYIVTDEIGNNLERQYTVKNPIKPKKK